MKLRNRSVAAAAAVVLLAAGAATAGGVVVAGSGDEQPLTGATYERAVAAALVGGAVTEAEIGDDGAAYEVEVRLPDGRQVEVQLDKDFAVIGSEADDDGPGDDDDDE